MDPGRLSLYSLYTFTGLRFSWISLFSYIIGFTGLTVRLLSPCLLSVCLSEWTRYPLPWLSVSKTTSPQRKFRCSVQPLRPKSKVFIYSATQCSVVIVWRTCSQDLFFFQREHQFLLLRELWLQSAYFLGLVFPVLLALLWCVSQSRKFEINE